MKKISFISAMILLISGTSVYAEPSTKSIFNDNSVIIYGTQNKDSTKDENMIAYNLKKQMKSYINLWSDDKINLDTLRRTNLIILGYDNSNRILNFTNLPMVKSNFPVNFSENSFSFGDKVYTGRNDSIAFIYPSPYNAKNYALIFYSNSLSGLENLTKNLKLNTGSEYQIISDKGVIREGKFNKNNFSWKYDSSLDNDYNSNED
ncbi:MAG: hypothetical protein U0354_19925 [Candidatus Sericytochromatia bacterium]